MELCNGSRCLGSDTIIVLCYAAGCIIFGLVMAALVRLADSKRSKPVQADAETVGPIAL